MMLDVMCFISYITLFLYQLAQAHPYNVLHFLVPSEARLYLRSIELTFFVVVVVVVNRKLS